MQKKKQKKKQIKLNVIGVQIIVLYAPSYQLSVIEIEMIFELKF